LDLDGRQSVGSRNRPHLAHAGQSPKFEITDFYKFDRKPNKVQIMTSNNKKIIYGLMNAVSSIVGFTLFALGLRFFSYSLIFLGGAICMASIVVYWWVAIRKTKQRPIRDELS
jgi:hypothetical protein